MIKNLKIQQAFLVVFCLLYGCQELNLLEKSKGQSFLNQSKSEASQLN